MGLRVAGCDLGKASAAFVIGTVRADGTLELEQRTSAPHQGRPIEVFQEWYSKHEVGGCAVLAATGLYSAELSAPALLAPEDSCQQAALEADPSLPDAVSLLSAGARGCSVLSRSRFEGGSGGPLIYRYLENDKCSSGTGENLRKIAGRFGLTVSQAEALARASAQATAITARCSVFAKSEMTHYANQGKPTGALFAGYFDSIARNAHALLARNQVGGAVLLIGGCARLPAFIEAFERQLGRSTQAPRDPVAFEAWGAALLAAEHALRAHPGAKSAAACRLPKDPQALGRARAARFTTLAPAHRWKDKVKILAAAGPVSPAAAGSPAVLGLDLGSTGAKAVLTSLETGEVLLDVYDQTRGNPIDAARRLVRAVLEAQRPPGLEVRAIGVTGSGREAVATLLRAVFPDCQRIVVLNEIVAHATAAIRCDPDRGRDLTVIEIGGQDAKYIRVSGGRIVESDLNKACSAGTGSFLEEQAVLYDVKSIEQFVQLASGGERPPDLGQMCTVYVADAAAEALKDGFSLSDVFAGFQYSIVRNYLNRVMGQRQLGGTVFFQGKPASNPSLAWTLAAITGQNITVPPNPGAMGAWGIGLCARDELGPSLSSAPALELTAILGAEISERSEFNCRDPRCQTLCPIERTTVRVSGVERVAVSGGACPKFEVSTALAPRLPVGAPDVFAGRERLLAAFEDAPAAGTQAQAVTIPLTGAIAGVLPWVATFVRQLGLPVRVLRSDPHSLARGEQLCNSFDACGPAKLAHAICEVDAPLLFFPKILDLADPQGPGGQTCVTEQAMPELVEQAARSRGRKTKVVRPVFALRGGMLSLLVPAFEAARALGADVRRVPRALKAAAAAQRRYQDQLLELGRDALAWAREQQVPVVLVCGPLHVIHEPAINATIPQLVRQHGALAVPMDAFPISAASTPKLEKVYWAEPNRYLRAAAAAREAGDVFPLMLSSFGCGPSSFNEAFFQQLLAGYPHTILESDGHGGTAGYVTRIQAFLQSVRQFRGEPERAPLPDNSGIIGWAGRTPRTGSYLDRSVRYVFLSGIADLGELFAAVYRGYGYDAVVAPQLSEENRRLGQRDCSGKECLSYQMIWGSFREYLEANPRADQETRLVQISGEMCRAGVFPVKDRITLGKMGLQDKVKVVSLKTAGGPGMTIRIWAGLSALDLLRQLYLYHLPAERTPGEAGALHRRFAAQILAIAERPPAGGLAGALTLAGQWRELTEVVDQASAGFAALTQRDDRVLRTVFVSGDVLIKGNDFANAGLYAYLAKRNVRVVVEGTCDFVEYLARLQPELLFGGGSSRVQQQAYILNMVAVRQQLYRRVRAQHPWLPMPDVKGSLARSQPVLDNSTVGGAALMVGSVLRHWETGAFDGAVLTACWGCDNGKVGESLLRNRRDIPWLFFYDDGAPLDERKVDSFAFRLGRTSRPAYMPAPRG